MAKEKEPKERPPGEAYCLFNGSCGARGERRSDNSAFGLRHVLACLRPPLRASVASNGTLECRKQYCSDASGTIRADRNIEILLAVICQGSLVPKPPYRSPKRAVGHGHCGERSEPQMKGGRV